MGLYAYATNNPNNGAHVQSTSISEVALIAMYGHGAAEAANTTNGGVAVDWLTNPAGSSTAQSFNTRSGAPGSTFLADSAPSASAAGRIFLSVVGFSHTSWRAHPLRPLLVSDGDGHHVDPFPGYIGSGTKGGTFAEPRQPCLTRSSRKSRTGVLFILGNNVGHHQKTGGGAFSMRAPHFDNDIFWVDKSAWANGMAQSQVWSMQLFGDAAPAPASIAPHLFVGD